MKSHLFRLWYSIQYWFHPPWDTGIPAPELVRTIADLPPGRAIDIGCGTGTNLRFLAEREWRVTGVDFTPRAIAKARRKLSSFSPTLIVADVTDLASLSLPGPYDLALDMGCFHGLSPEERKRYAAGLARWIRPGGIYLLYAWQPAFPGDSDGVSRENVGRCFSKDFVLWRYEQGTGHPSAWYYFHRKKFSKRTDFRNSGSPLKRSAESMKVHSYNDAVEFLASAGPALEAREVLNSLMLGICGQIVKHPERYPPKVCLKTVEAAGAPALAATMTPPQKLIVAGAGEAWGESTEALAASLIHEGWRISGVIGPGPLAGAVSEKLAAAGGCRFQTEHRLRLYSLSGVETAVGARGRLRQASAAELETARVWWHAARVEMFGKADLEESRRSAGYRLGDGELYLWEDREPVCMAVSTRPTKSGICIGMVYTPPDFRNRGYATACVGELCRRMLSEGRAFCTLFADLANPISNRIYMNIGFRPVGDFEEYGVLEGD
ncbi:MAG: GNAT family N-acetyltransferase [Anaerolineales bacterium]|nr:GNAT family N-acetyltransferase [Anaerolineales bacterium]